MQRRLRPLDRARDGMPLVVHLALALVIVVSTLTGAQAETLERPAPRIVNGILTGAYPSTGALLRGSSADTANAWCSGTLIGCSTFLTAGHCVDNLAASDFQVFLPHAGIFPVASIAQHPGFDFPAGDVAVLQLATPVVGVAPSAIETSMAPPPGTPGTIVGFGRSGNPHFDYGLKRAGSVVTAACSIIPSPGSDITSVCWNFSNPQGPPGSNANTCNADSGGPLFVDLGSGLRVAGVTSGGSSVTCLPEDHSYDANVFTYRSFITTAGGADLANTSCGGGPQAGDAGTTVLSLTGALSSVSLQNAHTFQVPAGATMLRIALNGVDDGASDFDLYVKAGSPPTTTAYDCARSGPNQFGVCEFSAPASGPWHVLVTRYSGAGTYQLTVTEFATDCATPGSDGNACDDENPCTTGDVCQTGTCAGTPLTGTTPCNDGNVCTGSDACQAGACVGVPLANGSPCDDGDPCSQPDGCQAGLCTGNTPALGCKAPAAGRAFFTVDDRSVDTRDRLAWSWNKGALTTAAELGTPTSTTPYTLCIYDSVGSVTQRRLTQTIPAGPRWKPYARGFRYRDSTLAAGGIQSVLLTAGAAGRSSVQVRGRGQPLALPSLPFAQQPNVIVQLLNDTTCWGSTYSTAHENSAAHFRGHGN